MVPIHAVSAWTLPMNLRRALHRTLRRFGVHGRSARQKCRGSLILRSAGVLACEFGGRPARKTFGRQDAVRTRNRDGCATKLKMRIAEFKSLSLAELDSTGTPPHHSSPRRDHANGLGHARGRGRGPLLVHAGQ